MANPYTQELLNHDNPMVVNATRRVLKPLYRLQNGLWNKMVWHPHVARELTIEELRNARARKDAAKIARIKAVIGHVKYRGLSTSGVDQVEEATRVHKNFLKVMHGKEWQRHFTAKGVARTMQTRLSVLRGKRDARSRAEVKLLLKFIPWVRQFGRDACER